MRFCFWNLLKREAEVALKNDKPNILHTMKCLGIVFVVVAHYVTPATPDYWLSIRSGIIPFIMPAFFLASGYLFAHTLRRRPDVDKVTLLTQKAGRLLLPYFSIAGIFLVAKFLSGFFFDLKNPASMDAAIKLLINPFESFMPLLWFIYALFTVIFISVLVHDRISPAALLLAVTVFYLFNPFTTSLFCLDKTARHFPFFAFGMLAASKFDLEGVARRYRILIIPALVSYFLLVEHYAIPTDLLSERVVNMLVRIVGLSFFVFLASYVTDYAKSKILYTIGIYTMPIYLFHTMFESSVRIGWNQVLGFGQHYWAGAFVAVSCGIIFPILLEKHIIRRSNTVGWLLLGVNRGSR